jgi:hypothetical protein
VERKEIIQSFDRLGQVLTHIGYGNDWPGYSIGLTEEEYVGFQRVVNQEVIHNGWFTKEHVRHACLSWGMQLNESNLSEFCSGFEFAVLPKRVAIIMAGNIPMVGFHDFLCVLLSGHHAVCKLSSDDKQLIPACMQLMLKWNPGLKEYMTCSYGPIGSVDAVIATGSNNSMLYFEQYFGKYPHIFRKNRTSLAVLTGEETKAELEALGEDIFMYFGMGCRNVSHLMIHDSFEINRFFEAIVSFGELINHNKYANNYDYNKAVNLLNQVPLLDNNFLLLKESNELHCPLAIIHYHRYSQQQEVDDYINLHQDSIQVVVGRDYNSFGLAQQPTLTDFADGVDTRSFLNAL